MLSSALRGRLRLAAAASRGAATAVAPRVLDWAALAGQLTSDEAKREVSKLKKTVEDLRESLAVKARSSTLRGSTNRGRAAASRRTVGSM